MLAATRGDGREGEDVTHNVSTRGAVQGLPVVVTPPQQQQQGSAGAAAAGSVAATPQMLLPEFEVRGEVYIKTADFEKVGGICSLCFASCFYGHGRSTGQITNTL